MTILLALLGVALVLELCMELVERVQKRWLNHQTRPYYPWSFCSDAGRSLTSDRGYLKLSIYPMSLYRNLPSQRSDCFRINRHGFRGPELEPESPSKVRVILLGGSTTFGTGLDEDSQTIAAHLEALLSNTEVVNAGVVGYQSGQELAHYVKDLADLRPDTVIALNGWNDFSQILHTSGAGGQVLPPHLMGFNWFTNMERALVDYSTIRFGTVLRRLALFFPLLFPRLSGAASRLARSVASKMRPGEEKSLEAFHRWVSRFEEPGPQADYFRSVVESYTNNVTLLKDIAGSRSARFLCVMQHPCATDAAAGLYRSFARAAMERFAARGVQAMNLCEDPARPGDDLFIDSIHLDDRGCREVASLIAARLSAPSPCFVGAGPR